MVCALKQFDENMVMSRMIWSKTICKALAEDRTKERKRRFIDKDGGSTGSQATR